MPYDITFVWSLKYDTNEPVYEIEIESGTQRIDWWLQMGKEVGERRTGSLGWAYINQYIQSE